ncbi:hypothetical protein ACGFNP_22330 [Nonomuraea sp. NPDC049269]
MSSWPLAVAQGPDVVGGQLQNPRPAGGESTPAVTDGQERM